MFIPNVVLDDQSRSPAALFSAKDWIEIDKVYLATAWKISWHASAPPCSDGLIRFFDLMVVIRRHMQCKSFIFGITKRFRNLKRFFSIGNVSGDKLCM